MRTWIVSSVVLVLASLAGAVAPAQKRAAETSEARDADEIYPARRPERLVRYFQIESDKFDLAKVRAALSEIGCEIAYGPRVTEARPGRSFLALSVPLETEPKKLSAALKKGGGVVRSLVCTAFIGRKNDDKPIDIAGVKLTTRDLVMGLSGKIAWFDCVGSWSQFYAEDGALDPDDLIARYAKLYEAFGGGTLGQLVHERFAWKLAKAPDAKQKEKLQKAVRKLSGVVAAEMEGEQALLVTVALADIEASLSAGTVRARNEKPLDEEGLNAPRAAWNTQALIDLLEAEQLFAAVAPSAAAPADAEPK